MKEKKIIKIFLVIASMFLTAVFTACLFASYFAGAVYAQKETKPVPSETAPAGARKKQAIEITGDLFEMESDNTYVITGNVHVYQGSRTITCERGTYNEKTGIVRAFTNVEIIDTKFKMRCQRVDSHMKENYSLFSGGVIVNGNNFVANSERAFYYEKEEKAVLIGNPVARSLDATPNEVHGERIIYFMKTERMEVLNDVTALIQPKSKDKEDAVTHISGNRLEILADGRYQVTDNLRVLKKDMILYADRGIYDETEEVTEAFGNVKVDTSKYTLTSGYVKHLAKQDRTIANIKPKLIQIVDKKKRVLPSSEEPTGGAAEDDGVENGDQNSPDDGEEDQNSAGADDEPEEAEGKKIKKPEKKISNKDKIILEANEIEALENSTHIVAKGDASLIQFPYLGQEGTEGVEINSKINSQIMDVFTEEGKMIAKQDVVLTSRDITAYGDTATYYEKEDRLDIEGNAHAVQRRGKGREDNDIVGEKITYFASTERILIKEPKIKFFQTGKEEKPLPEIEKDTAPVRLKRQKADSTSEAALASSTTEVSAAAASTNEAAVINKSGALAGKTSEIEVNKKGAAGAKVAPVQPEASPAARPDASESGRPRDPGANVRIKISPDGAVRDVKVKNK